MHRRYLVERLARLCLAVLAVSLLGADGCTFQFLSDLEGSDLDSGGMGVPDDEFDDSFDPLQARVTLRFVNQTATLAVDVQFYSSNEPLGVIPDELFVEANLVTRGIGLAGQGILGPGMSDDITFPCTPDLTVGTLGGEFTDAETGDLRGTGVSRWAQEGSLSLCGSVVTFEYGRARGEFATSVRVGG